MAGPAVSISAKGSDRPSLRDLHAHVLHLVEDVWYQLGLELFYQCKMEESQLLAVKSNAGLVTSRDRCSQMFEIWHSSSAASWDMLIVAMRSRAVGKTREADRISQMLACQSSTSGGSHYQTGAEGRSRPGTDNGQDYSEGVSPPAATEGVSQGMTTSSGGTQQQAATGGVSQGTAQGLQGVSPPATTGVSQGTTTSNEDSFDIEPNSKHFMKIRGQIFGDWHDIGQQMDIDKKSLDAINIDFKYDGEERKAQAMLDLWLKRKDPRNYKSLEDALTVLGLQRPKRQVGEILQSY